MGPCLREYVPCEEDFSNCNVFLTLKFIKKISIQFVENGGNKTVTKRLLKLTSSAIAGYA